MTTLIFGSEASEYVRVSFGDRPYMDSEHSFDRNQVAVQLDLFVRPFQASFGATWNVDCFSQFRSDLERVYRGLDGEARFLPDYDRSLEVTLTGDGIGHFSINGACANPATGPWFRFGLATIDQTYLPDLVCTLSDLEGEYPIL
jgi:hypothetical protein